MVDLKITLPDHFLDEETRDGYFVSSDMKKVWAVELDLLAEFRRVCDKYGLHWYADGGTMLGAVRHKGFIPWDNDIDISMPRKDYDLLCSVASSEFKDPYFFQTARTDKYYYHLHAQLRNSETTGILNNELYKKLRFNQGIFIDIFPFDSIPDNDEELSNFGRHLISLNDSLYLHNIYSIEFRKSKDPHFFNRVNHRIKHFFTVTFVGGTKGADRLFGKVDSCIRSYENKDTERFANMSLPRFTISRSNYFQKKWYDETVYFPFEFVDIPVPLGYLDYLNNLYGNWHEFVISGSCHGDTFFDVDRSYLFYINKQDRIETSRK